MFKEEWDGMFERCIFGEVIAPCVPHAGSIGGVLNSEPEFPLWRYYALHDLQFHSRWEQLYHAKSRA